MTDRYHSLLIVLDHDIRSDDAKPVMAALEQVKGVLKVSGLVRDPGTHMAYARARQDLIEQLWKVLNQERAGDERNGG